MPSTDFIATRDAGLERLNAFRPHMGQAYARSRNTDFGPGKHDNVSVLSPYIRHRLLSEQEVAQAALSAHGAQKSEKFVQEVVWRTYWKGWLEQRPQVWQNYLQEAERDREILNHSSGLRKTYDKAIQGQIGIECFDAWAQELIDTGYLHNHARMWFASIWIFTLKLPWALGAEFFYHHLLDGDAATNTLSWRWVGGLHTQGKTYLARPDNIAKFTNGRFEPEARELAAYADPLIDDENPPRMALPEPDVVDWAVPTALLATGEDCDPIRVLKNAPPKALENLNGVAAITSAKGRTSLSHEGTGAAQDVKDFEKAALDDTLVRLSEAGAPSGKNFDTLEDLEAWIGAKQVEQVVTPYIPTGPTRDMFAPVFQRLKDNGVAVKQLSNEWDQAFWPHATAGFFKVKKKIPFVLGKLGML